MCSRSALCKNPVFATGNSTLVNQIFYTLLHSFEIDVIDPYFHYLLYMMGLATLVLSAHLILFSLSGPSAEEFSSPNR